MSSISTVSKGMVASICGRLSVCMRNTVSVAHQYSFTLFKASGRGDDGRFTMFFSSPALLAVSGVRHKC